MIMKNYSILFFFLILTIGCFSKQTIAQSKNDEPKEKIIVELYLWDEYVVVDGKPLPNQKIEVPVETKKFDPLLGGGFATVDCLDCPLSSEWSLYIPETEKIDENQLKIYFNVSFTNKKSCNLASTLVVKREEPAKLKLKCKIKAEIVAYYQTTAK